MIRVVRYLVGAASGIFDLTGQLAIRDWIIGRVAYTGDTMDGFDLTSDLYVYHPRRLVRRIRWRLGR